LDYKTNTVKHLYMEIHLQCYLIALTKTCNDKMQC